MYWRGTRSNMKSHITMNRHTHLYSLVINWLHAIWSQIIISSCSFFSQIIYMHPTLVKQLKGTYNTKEKTKPSPTSKQALEILKSWLYYPLPHHNFFVLNLNICCKDPEKNSKVKTSRKELRNWGPVRCYESTDDSWMSPRLVNTSCQDSWKGRPSGSPPTCEMTTHRPNYES